MFCKKCSKLFVGTVCPNCSTKSDEEKEVYSIRSEKKAVEDADLVENAKIEEKCPECGNEEATYRIIQNRASDEPETIFYKCTNKKCQNNWKK